MPNYLFTVVLGATGSTPEAAWENAVAEFTANPGDYPNYEEVDSDTEETPEA